MSSPNLKNLDLISLINGLHTQQHNRCTHLLDNSGNGKYAMIIPTEPATGIVYVTRRSPDFISGHVRMRGRDNGKYPYKYLEMIENLFCYEPNTIEVCSNSISSSSLSTTTKRKDCCFTVDINPATGPDLVCDAETLDGLPDDQYNRWRCDPPYSQRTAVNMYNSGSFYPDTMKLLKAGARVCKPGSLMFLLLGPKNHQSCPKGVKRIGLILITVVPNNEIRALNIYRKYY